jgi:cobalt-precorrin-7 (C5)-methyltransferase
MDHKIIVVGIGPGSPDYLPPIAARAIARAGVLVGSGRALAAFAPAGAVTKIIDRDIQGVLAFIDGHLATGDVTVLVSGDPGFYSLLTALRQRFGENRLEVIPGISSVQLAFARLARPWQDARLMSLHGRQAAAADLAYVPGRQLAILTDGQHSPRHIARLLLASGWPAAADVRLCADLSYPDERLAALTLGEAAESVGFEHCVMVVMA